jgi:hypothetical protein
MRTLISESDIALRAAVTDLMKMSVEIDRKFRSHYHRDRTIEYIDSRSCERV